MRLAIVASLANKQETTVATELNMQATRDIFHKHCKRMNTAMLNGGNFAEPMFALRAYIECDVPDLNGTLELLGTTTLSEVIVEYPQLALAIVDRQLYED